MAEKISVMKILCLLIGSTDKNSLDDVHEIILLIRRKFCLLPRGKLFPARTNSSDRKFRSIEFSWSPQCCSCSSVIFSIQLFNHSSSSRFVARVSTKVRRVIKNPASKDFRESARYARIQAKSVEFSVKTTAGRPLRVLLESRC